MLPIKKLKGCRAVDVALYYTEYEVQRKIGEYYVEPEGKPKQSRGRWLGRMAARLGLAGEVPEEEFLRVLDGRDPRTGKRWMPWRKDHVAAHDLTPSAPKSVSVAGVLSSPETSRLIEEAEDYAIEVMLDYMTANVKLVRATRQGKVVLETAAEVLAVGFRHTTSRPTREQARHGIPPDPNRHVHVVISAVRRHDGKIVALTSQPLFDARQELQAVYHAAFATRLAALGFTIERETSGGCGFEIGGIPQALCEDLSGRTKEIHAHRPGEIARFREKYGRDPTYIELRDLDLRCKLPKGRVDGDPAAFWREVGRQHGVTAEAIEGLRRPGVLPSPAEGRAWVREDLLGENGLTKEHATFTTEWLRILALRKAAGVISVADTGKVVDDMIAAGDVVAAGKDRWTTREMIEAEKGVLAWSDERRPLRTPRRPSAHVVWEAIRSQQEARDVTFAGEQLTALRAMLTQRFTAITGAAGSGKTAIVGAAADVWHREKRRVFAVAVAGATAQRLGEDLGEDAVSMTLDGLVTRLEHGRLELRDDDVIVLDEAGMVDTRRWARFAAAVQGRADVVTLGDHAQLSPLSAGGLWPLLARGGPELQEVHRTQSRWERAAWRLLRTGEAGPALRLYARCGRVSMSATRSEAQAAAVGAWDADGRTGVIITDASNAERDAMNLLAQQRRQAAGELGDAGVRLSPAGPSFRTGDRVIFRRQWRLGQGIRRVENGTTGVIAAADPGRGVLTVRTNEQHSRDLEVPAEGSPLLELGYASHVYKSQGMTVGKSYVVSGGWQTHREALYVACSRAREGTHLFVDRETLGVVTDADALAVMAERGRRSRAKRAATARAEPPRESGGRSRRQGRRPQRPLAERYWRRRGLRTVRAEERRMRDEGASIVRLRNQRPRQSVIEKVAAAEGVPAWVVQTFQEVTGMRYADRHVV